MISVTKLLGGPSFYGDRLRYAETSGQARQGTAVGSGPVVVWNATKTCNLECVHCYADAGKSKFTGELTTAEAIALIDDLATINVPALLMSGGEPLVRPDIIDLATYAIQEKGIRVTFSTNGTLINEKVAKRLKEKGLALVLTEEAKDYLIEKGYSPEFGARPLRRAIEHNIEDPLAESLLNVVDSAQNSA